MSLKNIFLYVFIYLISFNVQAEESSLKENIQSIPVFKILEDKQMTKEDEFLLKKIVKETSPKDILKMQDLRGNNLLHTALINHPLKVELILFLINKGFDVNLKNKDDKTPLSIAIPIPKKLEAGFNKVVVKALLKRGAKIDVIIGFQSVLHVVTRYYSFNDLKFLFKHVVRSPNVDVQNPYSQTPLHFLAESGIHHLEKLEFLIQKQANPNAQDFQGNTPAHFFAKRTEGRTALPILLRQGANFYIKNHSSRDVFDTVKDSSKFLSDSSFTLENFIKEDLNRVEKRSLFGKLKRGLRFKK